MRQNTRKFIGVIITPLFLVIYVLVMMAFGAALAGHGVGFWGKLAYHAIAGVAWLPVVMVVIRWMSRPDAPADSDDPDRRQR